MARFLTHAFILEKYGPRLDKNAMAEVLGIKPGTVLNHNAKGTLGFETYIAHGSLWADAEAVASYLDRCAEDAKEAA